MLTALYCVRCIDEWRVLFCRLAISSIGLRSQKCLGGSPNFQHEDWRLRCLAEATASMMQRAMSI